MASATTKELCPLCFCFRLESFPCNELISKVEKYLHIKMVYPSVSICLNCYNSIERFHEFYERVQLAQKTFSERHAMPVSESNGTIKTAVEAISHNVEIKLESSNSNSQFEETDILQDKEINDSPVNDIKTDTNECDVKSENMKEKLQNSTFKEFSIEIEKKMIEFYNIKCEKCEDGKFTSFKMLNKHYTTVHKTQGYIKCCKRNIKVNDKYYLKSHMFKHLQPDSCRCRICGKELSSLATLKHHMILHKPDEERPFQCSHCKKRFCCKNDLKNHEKAIHVPENEREDYICDVCGKVFQKVANLRYHNSTVHLQEKKYICEICARCFTTQSGLKIHINAAHSTANPIQCHECNKWLKTKDTFQKHLQLHQNNSYPCKHCSKVCNSSASLRSHLVKHSERRPYPCTICKKSFKTKTHLKNHSTQHIKGSSFKCPHCPKLFANKSNYYTHRRRMHSAEKANKQEIVEDEGCVIEEPTQKINYDYKMGKDEPKSYTTTTPPISDLPSVRRNIIVSPVSVKFLS